MDDWLKDLPKICTHCGSKNGHKFLQMSNNKTSQPRYNCKSCKNNFTHNGKSHKTKAKQSVSLTLMKKSIIKKAKLNATQTHPDAIMELNAIQLLYLISCIHKLRQYHLIVSKPLR
jgi:transposase-like protein